MPDSLAHIEAFPHFAVRARGVTVADLEFTRIEVIDAGGGVKVLNVTREGQVVFRRHLPAAVAAQLAALLLAPSEAA